MGFKPPYHWPYLAAKNQENYILYLKKDIKCQTRGMWAPRTLPPHICLEIIYNPSSLKILENATDYLYSANN